MTPAENYFWGYPPQKLTFILRYPQKYPLKVEVSSNYNDVKDVAIRKRKAFDRTFNAERGYVLAYQDARIARQIPGLD